jgi:hypothetical protein
VAGENRQTCADDVLAVSEAHDTKTSGKSQCALHPFLAFFGPQSLKDLPDRVKQLEGKVQDLSAGKPSAGSEQVEL